MKNVMQLLSYDINYCQMTSSFFKPLWGLGLGVVRLGADFEALAIPEKNQRNMHVAQ